SEWHYRRRARLGVRYVPKKGGTLIGFRERASSYLTRLDTCLVLHRTVAEWLPPLHALIDSLAVRDRIPQIEVAAGDNAVALVFRHLVPLPAEDAEKLRAFGERFGAQIYAQAGSPYELGA